MEKVKSIEQLGCYLVDKYGTQPQEGCWIIAVDTQLNILSESLVAMGTLNQVAIHPRDVYRHLIAINAYGFMMVHNHPSGKLTASSSDYQVLQPFILCSAIIKIHFFIFSLLVDKVIGVIVIIQIGRKLAYKDSWISGRT